MLEYVRFSRGLAQSMARQRTATINALTALLRILELGSGARKPLTSKEIALIASWRERDEGLGLRTGLREAVRQQIISLQKELGVNHAEMEELVQSIRLMLLEIQGIGPVKAALILISLVTPGGLL